MKAPIGSPVAASLNELSSAGTTVMISARAMPYSDGAEVVERMAEGQDLVPVHVGHRPDGGEIEVAGDELDADRVPLAHRRAGGCVRRGRLTDPRARPDRAEPRGGEKGPGPLEGSGGESAEDQGHIERRDRRARSLFDRSGRERAQEGLGELGLAEIVAKERRGDGARLGLAKD